MSEEHNTTPAQTQERVNAKEIAQKGRRKVAANKQFKQLKELKIEYMAVTNIMPNPWNPNRQSDHDFELLLSSMREDGFTQPVIVLQEPQEAEDGQKRYMVVDGEHRWRAAATIGLEEIPVVKVDMDPAQARISTIRHNRARGSHDINLEAGIFRDLQTLGMLDVAADSLLMGDDEIAKLLEDVPVADVLGQEEINEAWIPDTFTEEEKHLISTGEISTEALVTENSSEGDKVIAATSGAVAKQRERQKLMDRAKSEQERQSIQKDNRMYRVSLIFNDDEADVVQAVLGKKPAERLLEICETIYAEMQAEGDAPDEPEEE